MYHSITLSLYLDTVVRLFKQYLKKCLINSVVVPLQAPYSNSNMKNYKSNVSYIHISLVNLNQKHKGTYTIYTYTLNFNAKHCDHVKCAKIPGKLLFRFTGQKD